MDISHLCGASVDLAAACPSARSVLPGALQRANPCPDIHENHGPIDAIDSRPLLLAAATHGGGDGPRGPFLLDRVARNLR
jgi:hypothetical protein